MTELNLDITHPFLSKSKLHSEEKKLNLQNNFCLYDNNVPAEKTSSLTTVSWPLNGWPAHQDYPAIMALVKLLIRTKPACCILSQLCGVVRVHHFICFLVTTLTLGAGQTDQCIIVAFISNGLLKNLCVTTCVVLYNQTTTANLYTLTTNTNFEYNHQ